jgi:hypothetical protein
VGNNFVKDWLNADHCQLVTKDEIAHEGCTNLDGASHNCATTKTWGGTGTGYKTRVQCRGRLIRILHVTENLIIKPESAEAVSFHVLRINPALVFRTELYDREMPINSIDDLQ